jgi:hypothetical protein
MLKGRSGAGPANQTGAARPENQSGAQEPDIAERK